jgi:hypothetical protein
MNFVFISPQYPPNWYLFCTGLARNGARVLAIADESYDNLHPELKADLTEYFRVSSLSNYDEVYRAVAYFIHRYGRIDRLESHIEHWLEMDGSLRQDFNIRAGLQPKDLFIMKRKSRMKEVFRNAGLAVADGATVANKEAALAFADKNGYPFVAKPDIGVGAEGVVKVEGPADLDGIDYGRGYFVESWLEGDMFTFDGYADAGGKVLFYTSHTYNRPVFEIFGQDLNLYYYSLRDIPEDLVDAGLRAVKAFDVRERFFHLEFFRVADNSLVALECNFRPPGGYTMDMLNYANQIDMYDLYAKSVLGLISEIHYSRPLHCMFVSRKNHFVYRHSLDDVRRRFARLIVFDQPLPPGLALMGHHAFMFCSPNLKELFDIVDFVWE